MPMTEVTSADTQAPHGVDSSHQTIPTLALLLLDTVEEGCVCDRTWRCTYLNAAAALLLGCQREEWLGQPVWSIFPEGQHSPFAQACRQAVADGAGTTFTTTLPSPERQLMVSLSPCSDGLALQLRGVDARAQHRRDLLAGVGLVLQTAPDAAGTAAPLVRHLTSAFVDWVAVAKLDNDRLLPLAAFRADSSDAQLPLDLAAAHQARPLQGERLAQVDLPGLFPSAAPATGVIVPLLVRGWLLGVITFLRHRTALALHELELAEEIAQRLADTLEVQRLEQEARNALVARDQFLAVAAHELRTPLTALRAHAQLVARRQAAGRLEARWLTEAMAACERAAVRLEQIRADLLAVARLRLDRMPVRRMPLDLTLLVQQLVDHYRAQLSANQRVQADLPSEPLIALVDPDHLDDILRELLDNAVKFSPAGATIRVWLERNGDGICLCVRDTGIGLPPGNTEAIFEPFNRAANAQVRQIRGLGLGLYRCRELLARNGGCIWAESQSEGCGTLMRCWLPRGDTFTQAATAHA